MEETTSTTGKRELPVHIKYLYVLATFFVLAISLSVSYYYTIALPKYNRQKIELEEQKRIDLENQKAEMEFKLQQCMDEAINAYWEYIKLNGDEVRGKPGVYTASQSTWDRAEETKKNAIDVCLKRFGK